MGNTAGKTILVIGMHRSGTSMVGGILSRLGVDLGEDSPGRQVSNPLGHYEDGDFLSLNESILQAAGGSWDQPPSPDLIQAQAGQYSDRIAGLIQSRQNLHPGGFWGWKDPRTSLTIGLFHPWIENLHIMWCQREAGEVAASLKTRNNFEQDRSTKLIDHYTRQIELFLERNPEIPVLVLPYQQIIDDPQLWIERIIDFLGIQPAAGQVDEAVNFVLPPIKIQQERVWLRWKGRLLLPVRALRKFWAILFKDQ